MILQKLAFEIGDVGYFWLKRSPFGDSPTSFQAGRRQTGSLPAKAVAVRWREIMKHNFQLSFL